MKNRSSAAALIGLSVSLLLVGGCRPRGPEEFAAKLPELPKDLDATLDTKTLATKVTTSYPQPERATPLPLAPCCGSTDTKSLKVNFPYTKCGPLRDFIVAPVGDLITFAAAPADRGGPGAGARSLKVYRRGEVNRVSVLDTIVCVTSQGPWNATLTEDRHCVGYAPQDTLIINAFGDVVAFVWNGGPANHPPEVLLVSCRQVGVTRFPCNAESGCDCESSSCAADQPCDCGLQGQW